MYLAPCILAIERRCKSLQCWMMTCRNGKRGFVFIIEGGLLLFASIRSVCRWGNDSPPSPDHSLQGRGRGLCPLAFSGPWLISGAPWQDNCEPNPFRKKSTQKGAKHLWRSGEVFAENWSNAQISPPKLERAGKPSPTLSSNAVKQPQIMTKEELCQGEVIFDDLVSLVYGSTAPSDRVKPPMTKRFMGFTDDYSKSQWNCCSESI